jgi:tetratricopeptide (TPR) repeat protein
MTRIKFVLISFLFFLFSQNIISAKENYFDIGKKFFFDKKLDKSKFKFEQDIVFNPKNEKSYLYLAKIYDLEKNDKLQEQNLNTVLLLDPKNEEAIYLLTLLKIKQSDYEKSKELIQVFNKVCNKLCENKNDMNRKLKNLQPK